MRKSKRGQYEIAFADWLGVRGVRAFWKGRVALYAALRALEVGQGDEVIVPGYTCVMAVNPILYLGAKPVYVDIDPATYNMDPARVESAVTSRTRVIIAQHTYGYPADMDALPAIAQRHGIRVVEDCCLALGSRWHGRTVGTFGVAAYFSSQWNKPFTTGLGGMLAVNDADLADKVDEVCDRELVLPGVRETAMLAAQLAIYRLFIFPRTTAMAQHAFRRLSRGGWVLGSSSASEFTPVMEKDFFKAMGDRQARAGLRQFERMEANLDHRRRLACRYDEMLAEKGFAVPSQPPQAEAVLVRYPVRVSDKEAALTQAARHFIELGSWFECPLHPKETKLEAFGYQQGMCPEAERASREVVNLPIHPRVSESTARRTVDFIAAYRI